jgi:hypothetical protein
MTSMTSSRVLFLVALLASFSCGDDGDGLRPSAGTDSGEADSRPSLTTDSGAADSRDAAVLAADASPDAPYDAAQIACPKAPPFDADDPAIKAACTKLVYLAGGDNFRVTMSSDDGASWQSIAIHDVPGDDYVNHIIVAKGVIWVIAFPGLYRSVDGGKTFVLAQDVAHVDSDTSGGQLSFGANRLVLTDGEGSYISNDGLSWLPQKPFSNSAQNGFGGHHHGTAYGNNTHLAIQDQGAVRTYDGSTWYDGTLISSAHEATGVAFGNGQFVAVGSAFSATSADGKAWKEVTTDDRNAPLVHIHGGVVFDGTTFRAFTQYNDKVGYVSQDGTRWTKVNLSHPVHGAAYVDGRFLGIGDTELLLSSDGLQWTPAHSLAANETFQVNGARLAVGRILK